MSIEQTISDLTAAVKALTEVIAGARVAAPVATAPAAAAPAVTPAAEKAATPPADDTAAKAAAAAKAKADKDAADAADKAAKAASAAKAKADKAAADAAAKAAEKPAVSKEETLAALFLIKDTAETRPGGLGMPDEAVKLIAKYSENGKFAGVKAESMAALYADAKARYEELSKPAAGDDGL